MNIRFEWLGKRYTVSMDAYDKNMPIVLPDGTALQPSMWLESYPPIPADLEEVQHLFKSLPSRDIALQLNGVLAEELIEHHTC